MIIEETKTGIRRHTMSRPELERLYKALETFVGDSTMDEYQAHKDSIKEIQTMIHERMGTADVPGTLKI